MKRAIAAFIVAAVLGYGAMWLHRRRAVERATFNAGYCAAAAEMGIDAGCP